MDGGLSRSLALSLYHAITATNSAEPLPNNMLIGLLHTVTRDATKHNYKTAINIIDSSRDQTESGTSNFRGFPSPRHTVSALELLNKI